MTPGTIFDIDPGFDPDPRYVQVADMNNDGINDVITSNYNSDAVSVLLGVEN